MIVSSFCYADAPSDAASRVTYTTPLHHQNTQKPKTCGSIIVDIKKKKSAKHKNSIATVLVKILLTVGEDPQLPAPSHQTPGARPGC